MNIYNTVKQFRIFFDEHFKEKSEQVVYKTKR